MYLAYVMIVYSGMWVRCALCTVHSGMGGVRRGDKPCWLGWWLWKKLSLWCEVLTLMGWSLLPELPTTSPSPSLPLPFPLPLPLITSIAVNACVTLRVEMNGRIPAGCSHITKINSVLFFSTHYWWSNTCTGPSIPDGEVKLQARKAVKHPQVPEFFGWKWKCTMFQESYTIISLKTQNIKGAGVTAVWECDEENRGRRRMALGALVVDLQNAHQ